MEQRTLTAPAVTIVIPSMNERDNVTELVAGLEEALRQVDAEVLFVDDSTDDTADVVRRVAQTSRLPLRVLQREQPTGGLAGAVRDGMGQARGSYVVVMDADLQHPPAMVPELLRAAEEETSDVVVASRYCDEGAASGLSSRWRRSVSGLSTVLARVCFPRRVGRVCTDPLTGFFCVRRASIHLERLRPRGFKILLEVLARHRLRVAEVPFVFGPRGAGESKASWRHGMQFLLQLAALRTGRMSRFAGVGALGVLVNLAVMWLLVHVAGLHYVASAVVATEVAILHNFLLQERFVFSDMRGGRHRRGARMAHFFAFGNVEMLVRTPLLVLLVFGVGLLPVLAQAVTLGVAFFVRFWWVSNVVYRARPGSVTPRRYVPVEAVRLPRRRGGLWPDVLDRGVLAALRPASTPGGQALQLGIPVAATLVAVPALPVRAWQVLSAGGPPAAVLVTLAACAVAGVALKVAPAPGEPNVHDRQLDVILAVTLIGGYVWLAPGWPLQLTGDQTPTDRHVLAATALLAGLCLLVVGTRASARLRFVLLLPLAATPQISAHLTLLLLVVAVTVTATLQAALAWHRRPELQPVGPHPKHAARAGARGGARLVGDGTSGADDVCEPARGRVRGSR